MKKKIITALFLFLICENTFAFTANTKNLYPINDNSKGGYIDKFGNIVIKQKYNFTGKFVGNYAIVEGHNLKKGIIDKKGNIIIDFKYKDLKNLSENFVIYEENKKFGYIDILKNISSKPMYDDIRSFSEGLAPVLKNGKWGFINKKGEYIVKPKYYDVGNFSEGLASFSESYHTTSGYINKKGEIVLSFNENHLEPKEFKEGLAPVIGKNEESCSYINKKGKIIIDNKKIYPINIYCGNFSNGLNVFYEYSNPNEVITGYINKKGKIKYSKSFLLPKDTLSEEFSVFDNFSSGMAQAVIDYKTGYISNKFKMKIPAIYEFGQNFTDDLAYVKFKDREGYINKKGQWVWFKKREGM